MSRVREMDPRRLDLLAGLFLVVEAQIELLIGLGSDLAADTRTLAHLVLVLPGIGLALRSRAPLASLLVAFGGFAAATALGPSVTDSVVLPFFSLFVVIFSFGARAEGQQFPIGVASATALMVVGFLADPSDNGPSDLLFGFALLVGAPIVAGRGFRSRSELNRALRDRAEALERERMQAAEEAVVAERERIAGELHDLISHALSGMVVQASGARRLAGRDPQRAREAFAAIEGSGREALGEMRLLLGVLRREDEEIALAPQPSISHLSTLVRRAEAAGLGVGIDVDGDPRPLPAGADVIAYRVVQEALRGAIDAGDAGQATVHVHYRDGIVEIEVSDDGHGERPLLGIRERVGLYGGELIAGRRRAGGHLVRASLPIGEPR